MDAYQNNQEEEKKDSGKKIIDNDGIFAIDTTNGSMKWLVQEVESLKEKNQQANDKIIILENENSQLKQQLAEADQAEILNKENNLQQSYEP